MLAGSGACASTLASRTLFLNLVVLLAAMQSVVPTLSNRQSSSALRHLPVTEPGSPRPQQSSGSSSGPTSNTNARTASAAARRTAQSWEEMQPRMPLALKGLPLRVMVEVAVLPPPLLGPAGSWCAEARR
jgi:hypothetical protein